MNDNVPKTALKGGILPVVERLLLKYKVDSVTVMKKNGICDQSGFADLYCRAQDCYSISFNYC